MRKEFVIDGNSFDSLNGFYDEVEAVFTSKLNWKIGRNLDAFNDILRGGFGRHEDNEPILIRWINYRKSELDLGTKTIHVITEIILDTDNSGHDCQLIKL